jgi:hypothetical protein
MTESQPNTELPTPKEFFVYAIELASLTKDSLIDSQGVREQVRDTLKNFNTSNNAIVDRIKEVEESYTPAVVENAVIASDAVLTNLGRRSNALLDRLTSRTDRVVGGLLLKTAIATLIVAVGLTGLAWLALQAIPTVTDIADRRATVQALKEQIGTLSQQLEVKGRLVFSNGRWYARYDNNPVNLCFDPPHPEKCDGPYVAVQ